MNKEKQVKKILKEIDHIINRITEDSKEEDYEKLMDKKAFYNYLNERYNTIFLKIDRLNTAHNHCGPDPIFGKYLGLDVRSSSELKKLGIETNYEIVKELVLGDIFQYLLRITPTKENQVNKNQVNNLENLIDKTCYIERGSSEKRKSIFKSLFNKANRITNKDPAKLLQQFGISKKDISDYVHNVFDRYANELIGVLDKLNKKKLEIGVIENFQNTIQKVNEINEKFKLNKKFYEKIFLDGRFYERELDEKTMYSLAINYALEELEYINDKLHTQNIKDGFAFKEFLYKDTIYNHSNFLIAFIKQNIEKTNHNEDLLQINHFLENLAEEIEKNKLNMQEHFFSKQDLLLNKAEKLASEKDPEYRKALDSFIKFSKEYSIVLEEDIKEIEIAEIIDKDVNFHIFKNEEWKNKIKEGYLTNISPFAIAYKNNKIPEIAKRIIDVKLKYIQAINRKY